MEWWQRRQSIDELMVQPSKQTPDACIEKKPTKRVSKPKELKVSKEPYWDSPAD